MILIRDQEINQMIILGNKYCSKCHCYKDKFEFMTDNSKTCGYYSSCRECVSKRKQEYYKSSADKVKRDVTIWANKNDNNRLLVKLRKDLNSFLKGKGSGRHISKYIGCSTDYLKHHIELLFKDGMSWDNYGSGGWTIDHKIACSKFNFLEEKEVMVCYHYTNLQPLWEKDNLKKSAT